MLIALTEMWKEARDREDGVTMVELIMVTFMIAVFGAVIYQTLFTFQRTTTATQRATFALSDVRIAVDRMSRDLRAAAPIAVHSPVADYEHRVGFSVHCSPAGVGTCNAQGLRPVVFRRSDNGTGPSILQEVGGVTTTVLGPTGPAAVPPSQKPGAVVNTASQPLLRYEDRNGVEICYRVIPDSRDCRTSSDIALATRFRDCTEVVRIHLVVNSDARRADKKIDLVTRVNLRNFNVVAGC